MSDKEPVMVRRLWPVRGMMQTLSVKTSEEHLFV